VDFRMVCSLVCNFVSGHCSKIILRRVSRVEVRDRGRSCKRPRSLLVLLYLSLS
jgi:hypothetical protein